MRKNISEIVKFGFSLVIILQSIVTFAQEPPLSPSPVVDNQQILSAHGASFREDWNYFTPETNECSLKQILNEIQADGGTALEANSLWIQKDNIWQEFLIDTPESETIKPKADDLLIFYSNTNFYFDLDEKNCLDTNPERTEQIEGLRNSKPQNQSFFQKLSQLPLNFWQKVTSFNIPVLNDTSQTSEELDVVSVNEEDGDTSVVSKNLNILGKTTVSNLFITNDMSIGMIVIDSLNNSINTIGKITNIGFQKSSLIIKPDGTLETKGFIKTKKVVVDTSNPGEESAGTAVIPAGQTRIEIVTTALTESSIILVTPERPVVVGSRFVEPGSFEITLEKAENQDLPISWFIVGNEQLLVPEP